MILVDADYRGGGIGKTTFENALECARAANCKVIGLDATDMGELIYAKYGFETIAPIVRWGRSAQGGFEFGEGHFDGVEIRTVGGKVKQGSLFFLDGGSHSGDLVRGKVVADDDVACGQFGAEDFFIVGEEGVAIHGAIQEAGMISRQSISRNSRKRTASATVMTSRR